MAKTVPYGNAPFYLFSLAFIINLGKIMGRIDFDQVYYNKVLKPLFERFETAFQKCEDRIYRNRADLIERNAARAAFEPHLHKAIELIRNLPNATEKDQKDLGIFIVRHGPRVTPAPADAPMAKHIPATDGYLKIRILNAKTGKIGKPAGASGCMIAYVVSDTPPDHESGYTNRIFVSGSLLSKKMEEHIGKKIQCRLYWVNSVGDESPWSANMEIVLS